MRTLTRPRPALWSVSRRATGLTIRELGPGETGPLTQVFTGMSDTSRCLRYLVGTPRLTASMIRLLTDVGHARHRAWVAEVDGKAVGIVRYARPGTDAAEAEVAVEVVDGYHGRGVGRALVAVARDAALAAGITALVWTARPENEAVRRLLGGPGASVWVVDGLVEGVTPLLPLAA
jgi:GNAT superfamily N-acetyltransferase